MAFQRALSRPGEPPARGGAGRLSGILIAGPTASGKSAVAIEVARALGGEVVNVAYGDTGHYVSLSLPDSVKDTKLLDTIAKRLDAELATGKYDSMFGR